MKNFIKNNSIIISILCVLFVAILGSIFVNLGMDWFDTLTRPTQWIPNIVIPICWTIIYVLFAIILSLLFKTKRITTKIIILSIVNGILNILWCLVFFTLHQTLLGNIIIILNTFFGVLLQVQLDKTNIWYTKLMWIYPIWLFIATSLNNCLWILN